MTRSSVFAAVFLFAAPAFAQDEGDEVPESAKRQIREQFGEQPVKPKKEVGDEEPAGDAPPKKRAKKKVKPGRKAKSSDADAESPAPRKKTTLPSPDEESQDNPSPVRSRASRPPPAEPPDTDNPPPARTPPPSPSPAPSPEEPEAKPAPDESPAPERTRYRESEDRSGNSGRDSDEVRDTDKPREKKDEEPAVPKTITIGVGGAYVGLFGIKGFAVSGSATNDWTAYGAGGSVRLAVDFPFVGASEARIGIQAALPGWIVIQGMAGIRQDLATLGPFVFFGRGGAGIEIFYGSGPANVIAPGIFGEGEMGAEIPFASNKAAFGVVGELDARYAIPLGFGFGAGASIRVHFTF